MHSTEAVQMVDFERRRYRHGGGPADDIRTEFGLPATTFFRRSRIFSKPTHPTPSPSPRLRRCCEYADADSSSTSDPCTAQAQPLASPSPRRSSRQVLRLGDEGRQRAQEDLAATPPERTRYSVSGAESAALAFRGAPAGIRWVRTRSEAVTVWGGPRALTTTLRHDRQAGGNETSRSRGLRSLWAVDNAELRTRTTPFFRQGLCHACDPTRRSDQ